MSRYIPLRLTNEEAAMLDEIVASNNSGFENRAEVFRLLLHREFSRRKGLPKPHVKQWQSVWRIGSQKKAKAD